MAGEWIECKLADACSSIDYGFTASAVNDSDNPRFLRITDIVSGAIDWNTVPYVVADQEVIKKYQLDDGDIVIARTGASTGSSAYIKAPPVSVFASYLVRLKAKSDFDSRYISYYLKSEAFWSFIRAVLGDKSAQPNASASTMTQAPFRAPKRKVEQQAIAHILGTLDDKIELNRKMNQTLEAMTRAIFKSWFVDFDPVRAKAEGRDTDLPKHFADLFPDSFQDSELGELPKGWGIRALYDCADYINGSVFRMEDFSQEQVGLPVIKIGELKDGITAQTKFSEKVFDSKYHVKTGDILFSWSGSPDTSIDIFIWTGQDGWLNQHIFKLVFKLPEEKYFVYYLLRYLKPMFIEIARNKQTTGLGHVTTQDLKRLKSTFPSRSLLLAFNHVIEPVFQRIYCNALESIKLVSLRNILLPKLISGELPIKDAERFIKRVAS